MTKLELTTSLHEKGWINRNGEWFKPDKKAAAAVGGAGQVAEPQCAVRHEPLQKMPGRNIRANFPGRPSTTVSILITGQIMGGKNNIIITRTGKRFPKKSWAMWRDAAVKQVREQIPDSWQAIDRPVNVRMEYWAGDKRRRDNPAIVDAIWHVLEKAGLVTDDWHLWPAQSFRGYDKENPRAVITFL